MWVFKKMAEESEFFMFQGHERCQGKKLLRKKGKEMKKYFFPYSPWMNEGKVGKFIFHNNLIFFSSNFP